MEDNIKNSKITIRDCSGPGFSAILKKFNINISNKKINMYICIIN